MEELKESRTEGGNRERRERRQAWRRNEEKVEGLKEWREKG